MAQAAPALPDGRRFAFTILDDTDDATVWNVSPVYELFSELGLLTTKTVWVKDVPPGVRSIYHAGHTLQRDDYLEFVKELYRRGFEIAWHGAAPESSTRQETVEALHWFLREFGFLPRLHCNHGQNNDNIYWGPQRYRSRLLRWISSRIFSRGSAAFSGEIPDSPYFWGDLCKMHFDYVRNLTFSSLDLLRFDPQTPYQHAETPWVNYWFSTTDAPDVRSFNRRITRKALDKLATDGGICIVSTHLGKGFAPNGTIDKQFAETLRHLSTLGGWYVPVSTILDHMLVTRQPASTFAPRFILEVRHAIERVMERIS